MNNSIDGHRLSELLQAKAIGKNIIFFEELDSTNDEALRIGRSGIAEGTTVVSEKQRNGRGRMGRTWVSEPGKNLTFSILLRPGVSPTRIGIIPLLAGVAVAQALAEFVAAPPVCKWPNDVLLNGGKVCGILCESSIHDGTVDTVVAGIGINVNQLIFSDDIPTHPVSMASVAGRNFDRTLVLASVLKRFEELYGLFRVGDDRAIIEAWKHSSTMLGTEIRVDHNGSAMCGTAIDIDTDGSLILHIDGQHVNIHAGDVTLTKERPYAARN